MQEQERQRVVSELAHSTKPLNKQAFHEKMDEHGVFVLVSSRRIRADKLLSLYYVRQDIEQVLAWSVCTCLVTANPCRQAVEPLLCEAGH